MEKSAETSTKRRAWVKNAIIIFLAVMLILTFFSNTIMNASLPEVAAQYAQSGSITSKIRTSANVKANSVTTVKIEETRKIKAVAVREGDNVQIGDVLFYLEDAESAELKTAREQLAALEKQYQLKMLVVGYDYYAEQLAITNKRSEISKAELALSQMTYNAEMIASLEAQLSELEAKQKALAKQIAAYQKEISKLQGQAADSSLFGESTADRIAAAQAVYNTAMEAEAAAKLERDRTAAALEAAEDAFEAATEAWEKLGVDDSITSDSLADQIAALSKTMRRSKEDYERARGRLTDQISDAEIAWGDADWAYYVALSGYNNGLNDYDLVERRREARDKAEEQYWIVYEQCMPQIDDLDFNYGRELEDNTEKMQKLEALAKNAAGYDKVKTRLETATDDKEAATKAANEAAADYDEKKTALTTAQKEYQSLQLLGMLEEYEATLEKLNDQSDLYTDQHDALTEQLAKLEGETVDETKQKELIASLKQELSTLQYNLSRKQQENELEDKRAQIEIDELVADINEQKALVKKYEANATDAKIVATVAGEVANLTAVAGQETSIGQTMCEIVVTELGYICEVTLSTEQARRVRVGDAVEVTNTWWANIKGTLVSLRNDPKNPGGSKIAVISLEGDVTAGQNLNLTIGEKGQTYDAIVPNSAIREDNNGKFVLVVEAKSSPLGNRYIARRYDVEVLASDDTSSAVSGLVGSEFIITTSTTPITNGNQVRLVEN